MMTGRVMKFRKKSTVIEAFQFLGKKDFPQGVCYCTSRKMAHIHTREGPHHVIAGDWIITDALGYQYPCRQDIFEKTYELVTDDDDDDNPQTLGDA